MHHHQLILEDLQLLLFCFEFALVLLDLHFYKLHHYRYLRLLTVILPARYRLVASPRREARDSFLCLLTLIVPAEMCLPVRVVWLRSALFDLCHDWIDTNHVFS